MALHCEVSFDIEGWGDSSKQDCAFKSVVDTKIIDSLIYESSGRMKLAAAASDVAFSLQTVTTGKLILLRSTAAFSVKINGTGNPAIALAPITNTSTNVVTPAFLIMLASSVTTLHFSNAGTSTIEVDIAIAGV